MTQRTKLELEINKPTEITLLYDEPVTGRSQYGEYFLYAVAVGDAEYSFFAPDEVHSQIKDLHKGDRFQITKLAAQRGSKLVTTYDVKLLNKEVKLPLGQSADHNREEDGSFALEVEDGLYEIMLRSYKEAIKITSELGGLIEPSRIAISLFIARSKQSNY